MSNGFDGFPGEGLDFLRQLGTKDKVSPQRLERAWEAVESA